MYMVIHNTYMRQGGPGEMNYPDIIPSVRSILHTVMEMMSSSSTDNSPDSHNKKWDKGSNNHQTMLGWVGRLVGLSWELMIGFVIRRWNVIKIAADFEYTLAPSCTYTMINYWSTESVTFKNLFLL